MPIHATYGLPSLPELQVVQLEENIAEISRLGRTSTARDLYDLAWINQGYLPVVVPGPQRARRMH